MERYLLDTNVLSELRRPQPNPGVMSWLASADPRNLFISVLTVGELWYGVERLRPKDPEQAEHLSNWLKEILGEFASSFTGVDSAVTAQWARIRAGGQADIVDGLLAASAVLNGWTLVTRHARDFAGTGCLILNPFT